MSALEKRYRRNFVVAVLLHVVLVGGIVLLDQTNLFGNRTAPPEVIEGIIIGDPPVGPGTGLGRYHAPAARTQSAAPPSAPAVAPTPADEELPAPPQPRAA